jgi:hypothetical protein
MSVIADYDSAAFMHRAVANFLQGRDFDVWERTPGRIPPSVLRKLLSLLNRLPQRLKIQLAVEVSARNALKFDEVSRISEEQIARELVAPYPRKRYPAIAIGSSNGALVHLYAALGIPWLPQTNLVLVRRDKPIQPDDMRQDAESGRSMAGSILAKNPNLALYQMNDPAQDRFMAIKMTYLRLKFLNLPTAYRQFIQQTLEPGGTILVVNCANRWPSTRMGERHYFQVGGYGGTTLDEYLHGGPRVKEFLRRSGSHEERFLLPEINGEHLEAEWGFDSAMLGDIKALAGEQKFEVKTLQFSDPQDPVRPIADFYCDWYESLGRSTDRLLIESFMLLEPYWCLKTGCIPYWAVFTGQPSYDDIADYVRHRNFQYQYLTLFSNIVRSIGVPDGRDWERIIQQTPRGHALLGVDPDVFPFDLLTTFQFFDDVKTKIPFRNDLPSPVPLQQFEDFIAKQSGCALQVR